MEAKLFVNKRNIYKMNCIYQLNHLTSTNMRHIIPFVGAFLLLAMTACEFVLDPSVSVYPETLEIPAAGAGEMISVSAVGEWKAFPSYGRGEPIQRFFLVSPAKGVGKAEVFVAFDANPFFEERRAEIVFECTSGEKTNTVKIPVVQKAADPVCEFIDWQEIRVPADGGTFSAVISVNYLWWLELDAEDVSFSRDKAIALGTTEVTFTVPANPTHQDRTICVTTHLFGCEEALHAYQFTQSGY